MAMMKTLKTTQTANDGAADSVAATARKRATLTPTVRGAFGRDRSRPGSRRATGGAAERLLSDSGVI